MTTVYFDISNLYNTQMLTGIQRVVRSILPEFINRAKDYEIKIITFDPTANLYRIHKKESVLQMLKSSQKVSLGTEGEIGFDEFASGDIFFDLDSSWNMSNKRSWVYPILKQSKVTIYTYLYDLVPILFPQHIHPNTLRNFVTYLAAVYTYSDLVLTDSRSTEKDFLDYKDEIGVKRHINTLVTKLGSDFTLKTRNKEKPKGLRTILNKKYVLFVGTLEPRKNQRLMLESFSKISLVDPKICLVFVGKHGWLNDTFIKKLLDHPLYESRVFWLQGVDDYDLEKLYKKSFLNVYLSNYEGYGLPIAEALKYRKPIIASRNSSMYEVATDFADYVQYGTPNELSEIISLYLTNKHYYRKKIRKIKKYYKDVKWSDVFNIIDKAILSSISPTRTLKKDAYQHVCISIRPDDFKRLVTQTDKYVSCVKEYIVVTRNDLTDKYLAIKSKHKIIVIDEKLVLGKSFKDFRDSPHQRKNWILRAALPNLSILDDEYIMLDDDNLPIKRISTSHFTANNAYIAYYYNDLLDQVRSDSSYDIGQQHTAELLNEHHMELLSYSSHAPQIINKGIFKEMVEIFAPHIGNKQVDEWSMYFNYAATRYPTLFQKTLYQTLNWPPHPNDWQLNYIPTKYSHENYYASLYEDGFFKGLNVNISLKEKTYVKNNQLTPHIFSKRLMNEASQYCADNDMVHGLLRFKGEKNEEVIISNVPYIFAATPDILKRVKANYKILHPEKAAKYEILLQNSAGMNLSQTLADQTAYVVGGYEEGVIELPIHVAVTGLKDLNFVVKKNGKEMTPAHIRYDSIVVGCEPGVNLNQTLASVTPKMISEVVNT